MNQHKDPVPASHRKETNVRHAKSKTRVPLDPKGLERTGDIIPVVQVLRNDPCLRHNEVERVLLLLLDMSTALVRERDALAENMPSHLASPAADGAYECAVAWQILGEKLQCAGGKAGQHSTTEVRQQRRDATTTSSIGTSSLGA